MAAALVAHNFNVYLGVITRLWRSNSSTDSVLRTIDPSKSIIRAHIDAFFEFVHPAGVFNFIHRGSFLRTWHRGKISKPLLCVLAGVASRFMNVAGGSTSPARAWVDDIQREITGDLETISLPKLQIILILIYDRLAAGKLTTVWYLTSLASRIAYGLRLNHPTDAIPFMNQECRRRLMWCTYVLDRLSTYGGLDYPHLCPRESVHVQLPCNPNSFDNERECKTGSLRDLAGGATIHNVGDSAYLIRILDIRDRIDQYLHGDATSSPVEQGVNSPFWSFREELTEFSNSLPADLRNTDKAMYIKANTSEANTYIMLQTWWHVCYCKLFDGSAVTGNLASHFAVSGTAAPRDVESYCRSELSRYVMSLNRFWRSMHAFTRSFFVTDWLIAPCVWENTMFLLRLWEESPSLLGSSDSVRAALLLNLDLLRSLKEISPYVESFVGCPPPCASRLPYSFPRSSSNRHLQSSLVR